MKCLTSGGTWKYKYLGDPAVNDVRASFGGSLLHVEKLSCATEWKQPQWLVSKSFLPCRFEPKRH